MTLRTALRATLFTLLATPWHPLHAEQDFDVLAQPSVPSDIASHSLIYSLRKFGNRYFATGIQGHIIFSDDGGKTGDPGECASVLQPPGYRLSHTRAGLGGGS